MKHRHYLFILSLIFLACNNNAGRIDSVATADSANKSRLDNGNTSDGKARIATDEATSKFLVHALDGGMMEFALGNFVAQKAEEARVKNFAEMIVSDHGKANAEMRDLAAMLTVTVPQGTSGENTEMIKKISSTSGKNLEREYISIMVDDHTNDIKEFKTALTEVRDVQVQAFIKKTIPLLQKHLDSCREIKKSLHY